MINTNIDSAIVYLANNIRLRQESFGGLVYDMNNGNTVEVDRETFQFLNMVDNNPLKVNDVVKYLSQNKIIRRSDKCIDETLRELLELRIIEQSDELPISPVFKNKNLNEITHRPWLSAPETVHWAVTYRCSENCPDCYTHRFSFIKEELNTTDSLKLIDKIAKWNVFQLAIGGGEPFLRDDLLQIVRHAAIQGLSVHITTAKLQIDYGLLRSISPFIKNMQLGIRPWDLIGLDSIKSSKQIQELFNVSKELDITLGANIFLNRSTLEQLENLTKILIDIGFNRIIFLRYKPTNSIKRWREESPGREQLNELHKKLNNIIIKNPILNIRVDCALSFVQRYLPKKLVERFGIKGCVAASRILAIAPDGSVYPCSQLVHPNCYAGNLLESDPELLWNQSQALRKYRSFRVKKTFTHSWCGVCMAKDSCGGCRVFTRDGIGQDIGCPEPLLPPLNQLGKIGRSLDLVGYLKSKYAISVGEYMERYKVGQQKAIKELNVSPYTISATGKSARKKRDVYEYAEKDIILDIQDAIGATSGEIPFASHEEIKEWIEDPTYSDSYPCWLDNKIG